MMKTMDNDLQFLVHFFNDKQYLFKTITMAGVSQAYEICNTISSQKGWFWVRFSQSERDGYLKRRLFVEKAMYQDYTKKYGGLREKVPVYLYLYPNITKQKAVEMAQHRTRQDETEPKVLMVKLEDIDDIANITFTLNDSHTAYWKSIKEAGLEFGGDINVPLVLPDHNTVFPFSRIEDIHKKYKVQEMYYEVQIWDYAQLERIRYTILGKEEA
jgi:hypothetical protein